MKRVSVYLYVRHRDRKVESALRARHVKFLPISIARLAREPIAEGVLFFAEDSALLRAILLAWPKLSRMNVTLWNGKKFIQYSKMPSSHHAPMKRSLPRLFKKSTGIRGHLQELCLKLIWPALGEQQLFNDLLLRSVGNLSRMLEEHETQAVQILRECLVAISLPKRRRRANQNRDRRPREASGDGAALPH